MASTSGSPWRLFCQAVGHNGSCLGRFFSVSVPTCTDVDDLYEEIFKRLPGEARKHVPELHSTDLELWKLSKPISTTSYAIHRKTLANLEFPDPVLDDENPDDAPGMQLLNPSDDISACWDQEPPTECLHLVVRVPQADGTSDDTSGECFIRPPAPVQRV